MVFKQPSGVKHWNKRYKDLGDSGYGTYDQMKNKLSVIYRNIPQGKIKSIIDYGCGDFVFGLKICELFPKAKYTGIDQSGVIIERNKKFFNPNLFTFKESIIFEGNADLIVCMDVLFHIDDDKDYYELLNQIKKASWKYFVVSAFDRFDDQGPQMKLRKFNREGWGTLVDEFLLEPEGAYMMVWKK